MSHLALGIIVLAATDPFAGHPLARGEAELFRDAQDRKFDSLEFLDAAFIASGQTTIAEARRSQRRLTKRLDEIVRRLDSPSADPAATKNLLRAVLRAQAEVQLTKGTPKEAAAREALARAYVAMTAATGTDGSNTQRGERLLALLHQHLFSRYDRNATDLRRLLKDGTYNCVSATVAYNAAADRAGLVTRAIVLPSHVLSLLFSSDGPVEVETTSRSGFHRNRTSQSYIAFLTARGLGRGDSGSSEKRDDPFTVDDVALVGLIYWNRAVVALHGNRYETARALIRRARVLAEPSREAIMRDREASIVSQVVVAAAERRDYARAIELIELIMSERPPGPAGHGYEMLEANRAIIYGRWADETLAAGKVPEALALFDRGERDTADPQLRIRHLIALHNLAADRINAKDCAGARPFIEKGLAFGDERTFKPLQDYCRSHFAREKIDLDADIR